VRIVSFGYPWDFSVRICVLLDKVVSTSPYPVGSQAVFVWRCCCAAPKVEPMLLSGFLCLCYFFFLPATWALFSWLYSCLSIHGPCNFRVVAAYKLAIVEVVICHTMRYDVIYDGCFEWAMEIRYHHVDGGQWRLVCWWWYVRGLQYERHLLDDLAMELMDRRNNFQVRLYTF
jgi:hypothetical protein